MLLAFVLGNSSQGGSGNIDHQTLIHKDMPSATAAHVLGRVHKNVNDGVYYTGEHAGEDSLVGQPPERKGSDRKSKHYNTRKRGEQT